MMEKKDLLITPSLYTLFLYTLINEDWTKSDFVLSTRIPMVIHQRLRSIFGVDVYTIESPKKNSNKIQKVFFENSEMRKYYNYSADFKYQRVWGNDEFYPAMKYRKQGIRLIEDGPFNGESRLFFKKRRLKQETKFLLFWTKYIFSHYLAYGYDSKVTVIYHTPGIRLNKELEPKGKIVDIKALWSEMNEQRRRNILNLFGIDSDFVNRLNEFSTVLVTQILPIPDDDKIAIYNDMVKGIEMNKLLIKTHYAETTNYSSIYPESTVISTPVPMQLFDLLGFSPTKILTISSSAIQPFVKDGVDVTFLGTGCDKRIQDVYGVVKLENIIKR